MEHKPPTTTIEAAHREHLGTLPFDDTRDFTDADRGFIAAKTPCVITAADGRVVWTADWGEDARGSWVLPIQGRLLRLGEAAITRLG